MTIPQGWLAHPNAPGWMYNQATNQVAQIPQGQPAVPAQPAVAVAQSQTAHGSVDLGAIEAEYQAAMSRGSGGGDELWLDFPEFSNPKLDTVYLHVRFLPPWTPAELKPYIERLEFRIPKALWPNARGKGDYETVVSYNSIGGPGNDPIQAVLNELKTQPGVNGDALPWARKKCYWQAINLDNTQVHWMQKKDANGNPVLDANGQPSWTQRPGLLRAGSKLHNAVLRYFVERKKDATSDAREETDRGRWGFGFRLIKRKTGTQWSDVEYDAVDMEPQPFLLEWDPFKDNLVNLRDRFLKFRSAEEMAQCAQNILAKFGAVAQAQVPQGYTGVPAHQPQFAYQAQQVPQTQAQPQPPQVAQVPQAAGQQPGMAPPPPAVQAMQQPPGPPQGGFQTPQAPQVPQMPQAHQAPAMPPAMPPAAPGGYPQPPPPVAPGLVGQPSVAGPPPPPPQQAPSGQVYSPDQLDAALAAGVPFGGN